MWVTKRLAVGAIAALAVGASLGLALATVELALGSADAPEIEPEDREALFLEALVELVDHLVVHGPTMLRVRVQQQGDRRIGLYILVVAPFQPALRAIHDDFRHGWAPRKDRLSDNYTWLFYTSRCGIAGHKLD